ncbi:hypothetical protein [Mesorhizobium sp. M0244]|uniref:hypothetical protein n=1 Tax=Mesorhizobium sp. M0244 TaxID=2956926 RepID=UPI0033384732
MRIVIHEVVADIDEEASKIVLLIHWIGGVLRLPRRRRGQRNSTSADILAAVRQLVLIANGDLIAGILNRNGLVTGHGNRWTLQSLDTGAALDHPMGAGHTDGPVSKPRSASSPETVLRGIGGFCAF